MGYVAVCWTLNLYDSHVVCAQLMHLFEREAESFDISTPLGAWHYATVLSRLAVMHSEELFQRFSQVQKGLVESLKTPKDRDNLKKWTLTDQEDDLQKRRLAKKEKVTRKVQK